MRTLQLQLLISLFYPTPKTKAFKVLDILFTQLLNDDSVTLLLFSEIDTDTWPSFYSHFLRQPGLVGSRMSPFWMLLELRIMQMVTTTVAGRCCKAPVKSSPPTNQRPVFLWTGCPSCCSTSSVTALKWNVVQWDSKRYFNLSELQIMSLKCTHCHHDQLATICINVGQMSLVISKQGVH